MGSGRSKSVWLTASERALKDSAKTHADLMKLIVDGMIDPTNRPEFLEFISKANAEGIGRNRDVIQLLWTRYDVNRDGVLSKEEAKVLCKDALSEAKRFAPVMVRELITQSIKTTKLLVRKMAAHTGTTRARTRSFAPTAPRCVLTALCGVWHCIVRAKNQ